MGFLDQIQWEQAAALEKEHEELLAALVRSNDIAQARAKIISQRLVDFAKTMELECAELVSKGQTRYFLIGDLVFVVRIRGNTSKDDLTKTARSDVLWQYTYALVGIDRTGQSVESTRGTLALIDFPMIMKMVRAHPSLAFNHEQVIPILYPASPD